VNYRSALILIPDRTAVCKLHVSCVSRATQRRAYGPRQRHPCDWEHAGLRTVALPETWQHNVSSLHNSCKRGPKLSTTQFVQTINRCRLLFGAYTVHITVLLQSILDRFGRSSCVGVYVPPLRHALDDVQSSPEHEEASPSSPTGANACSCTRKRREFYLEEPGN
jgi:hypothetical protein